MVIPVIIGIGALVAFLEACLDKKDPRYMYDLSEPGPGSGRRPETKQEEESPVNSCCDSCFKLCDPKEEEVKKSMGFHMW